MRARRVLSLVVIAITLATLISGGASAEVVQHEMLQNPDFTNGSANWTARTYISQNYYGTQHIYVRFLSGEVEIYVSNYYGDAIESYAYGCVEQTIAIPNFNASRVVSATLTMRDVEYFYGKGVYVRLYFSSTGQSFTPSKSWTIRTMNVTNLVKQNVGKNVSVKGGFWNTNWIDSGSKMYIDWIYLNITYNATNSGGSGGGTNNWWGNGGGWSGGGGGSWNGGGGFWHGGGGFFGILGGWFGHTGNVNQTYVEYEVERLQELLAIGAGITISILWVNVAVNYFSGDPDRKAKAKEKMTTAFLGTLLVAMAVIGAMWAIAGWLVGGG